VDLPFVESKFLAYLIACACQCAAVVTVPHPADGWQPLCAVYRREFAAVAESALRRGKNRIDVLFSQVETRAIREEELVRMGFSSKMFRNLNTPEEWQKASAEFEARERTQT
jgi:molybdopterin-guanine dinucleotide biosynthesis protein A